MSPNLPQISPNAERDEPTTGESGVPIWLILLLAFMLYLGMSYIDRHGGWFNAQVFEPYSSYEAVVTDQPYDPEGAYLALGKKTFEASCALCHQLTGLGKEGQFPPLVGSDWLLNRPNWAGRIVLNGLKDSIRVDTGVGTISINASMAPLGDPGKAQFGSTGYSDEQLGAALTYVRKQWGNNGSKITPDQIKKIRAAIAGHPGQFTGAELEKVPYPLEAAK